jgi:release factor glutamine methyltransferase
MTMISDKMTRIEALKHLGDVFRQVGIETAQRDARLLMLDASGIVHADLIRAPREAIGSDAAEKLTSHVEKRLTRVPVARILGEWEFWSLPFTLVAETLVPRPDSETVVAAALIALKDRRHASDGLRILDLGTGSGCLLISLLHELPGAIGVGVDIASGAIETARLNAERNHVDKRATFYQTNWAKGITGPFDLIVSNPPYIADPIIDTLEIEVRLHDPRLALSGGRDGLDAYRAISEAIPTLLAPGGIVALEIGSDQAETVPKIFAPLGYELEGPFADFGARPRAIILRGP